ncbi:MBL fold metallo-hydrolase [Fundidesulfovibrio terrae]|uniref:MBL fold metallo-hydrolase n=1 Tax=Fundidesulfovibrio terrae TaxID=2922866 RepID=UPI001FAFFC78|nr:MBL fold metallo-hydrolase [Fundidesulfovibrio terrae]
MNGMKRVCGLCAVLCLLCTNPAHAAAKEELMGSTMVGDVAVFILSDGYRDLDASLFLAIDSGQVAAVKDIYPGGKTRNSLNTFLLKSGGRLVLVDTGGGSLLGSDAGGLPKALAAAGFTPQDVTDVILTHVHRDHIGGLGLGGRAAFPGAVIHISKVEHDFWTNPENEAKAPERTRGTFATTREMLALYPGKVALFEPGGELFPGIRTIAAYGHTPGHSAVLVSSKGENLLLWGDLLHGLDLQLAKPDIAIAFDWDPAAAVSSRKVLLSKAAAEGWRVSGVHVPGPEAYRIRAEGQGFSLVR